MRNSKIETEFNDRILSVTFKEDAVIDAQDLKEIYELANHRSKGEKYGVLFEALAHYDVTDDALEYMAENPSNANVIAKVYVINNKEAEIKTKLHLIFDHPSLKPYTFNSKPEALNWLRNAVVQYLVKSKSKSGMRSI